MSIDLYPKYLGDTHVLMWYLFEVNGLRVPVAYYTIPGWRYTVINITNLYVHRV